MIYPPYGKVPTSNYGHYIEGFFVPPINGNYKFYVAGDDIV